MGFFERLGAAAGILFRPQASNELRQFDNIEDAIKHASRFDASSSGVVVTMDAAQRQVAVYACVRILRETIAHLPLVLYRTNGNTRLPDVDNPLYRLLKEQPNEWQTAMEWRELKQSDLEFRGNAYSLIVRGTGGRVVELIRLHPDKVEVVQNNDLTLAYTYTKGNGQRVRYAQSDIFHIRGVGTDGIKGESPITLHRETIGNSIAMQRHGSKFFSNGALLSGLLEMDPGTQIGQEARQALKEDFESMYSGVGNAGKTALLPGGVSYKPVSMTLVDAQYIEARKFTRNEIFSVFGVPPHKGGDLERATFSNIEHQALEFVQDAIVPRCTRWEQAIKRDLLSGDPQRYVKHNVAGLLRGDAKSRAEAQNLYRRMGVYSANDIRAMEDMNPRTDAGGDDYIVEMNMRPDDGTDPAQETGGRQ